MNSVPKGPQTNPRETIATPITRRTFIANAVLASYALPLYSQIRTAKPTHSCIVVGAGFAGLTAAYRLSAVGWKVTVLEARNRPAAGLVLPLFAGSGTGLRDGR